MACTVHYSVSTTYNSVREVETGTNIFGSYSGYESTVSGHGRILPPLSKLFKTYIVYLKPETRKEIVKLAISVTEGVTPNLKSRFTLIQKFLAA